VRKFVQPSNNLLIAKLCCMYCEMLVLMTLETLENCQWVLVRCRNCCKGRYLHPLLHSIFLTNGSAWLVTLLATVYFSVSAAFGGSFGDPTRILDSSFLLPVSRIRRWRTTRFVLPGVTLCRPRSYCTSAVLFEDLHKITNPLEESE